jgi:hypothetical protein
MEPPLLLFNLVFNGYLRNIKKIKLVNRELYNEIKYCFNCVSIDSKEKYETFILMCKYCQRKNKNFMIDERIYPII